MEELKTQVFKKYNGNKEKLEEFIKIYTLYTIRDELMLEYDKLNEQCENARQQLLLIAEKAKEANRNWDEIKEQLNKFN